MSSYLGPDAIIAKKQAYIMPCLGHFYERPPQFVRGEMQYLYDHQGKNTWTALPGYPLSTAATATRK